ncbi:hypothetical protein J4480_00485 [Candidatus Woesearchaeota archaeon]|nr:hypothetical protein [Candidatus Woesearchaeota archaeon]
MLLKKRGYFFVLDAVLGLIVLVTGVVLITSSYINAPQPVQVELLSDDLLNFLSNTKIKDLNNPYAGIGGELWKQGEITDAENSLLQQAGEFYATNKPDTAEKFIQNVSKDIIPSQFRYEVWMNDIILYPKTPTAEHIKSKDGTGLLLTSKKITFGIVNKTTSNLWGPYNAEVFIWEK